MITKKQKLRIRRKMVDEKPSLLIGRNGATKEVVEEAKKQLKSKEVVKIKVLKKALEQKTVKDMAEYLVDNTGSELIETRGHTMILYKARAESTD